MRTLSEQFRGCKDAASGAPVTLAVLHLPAGDLFVSDRDVDTGDGPAFVGLVTKWGGITSAPGGPYTVGMKESELTLAVSAGSALEADGVEGIYVELSQWFEGLGYDGRLPLGRFVVEGPVSWTDKGAMLRLAPAFAAADRIVGTPIGADDYPGADPDATGKLEGVVYGRVSGLPCRAVDAGAATTLAVDASATQTAGILLSLAPGEVPLPPSGTLQAGSERLSYSGVSGRELTGVVRGASGTHAASHKKGAAVFEVRPAYTYLVAGHPVRSIGDVYVDGVRVASGVTRLTDDGGKAKLALSSKFTLEKSVDLGVSEGSHNHTVPLWSGAGTRTTQTRWTPSVNPAWAVDEHAGKAFADSAGNWFFITGNGTGFLELVSVEGRTVAAGTYTGAIYKTQMKAVFQDTFSASYNAPAAGVVTALCDGDFNAYCAVVASDGYVETRRSLGLSDAGRIVGAKLCSMRGNATYAGAGRSVVEGGIFDGQYCQGGGTTTQAYKADLRRNGAGAVGWPDFAGMAIRATFVSGTSAAYCSEHWVEVYYIPEYGGDSPASGVALTGDSSADFVVGRVVTCDLEGWQDNSLGSFTGAPGALIERPPDVAGHYIRTYMGVPASECAEALAGLRGSFDAAAAGGYRFAGVLDRREGALSRLGSWCGQAMMRLRHDGYTLRADSLWDAGAAAVKAIGPGQVARGGVAIVRAPDGALVNTLVVHYMRDPARPSSSADDYAGLCDRSDAYPAEGDASSVGRYGPHTTKGPLLCDFIMDGSAASRLRDFLIGRGKDVKRAVSLSLFLDCVELEEGDVVQVAPLPGTALPDGGLFRIEDIDVVPGSARDGRPDTVRAVMREV